MRGAQNRGWILAHDPNITASEWLLAIGVSLGCFVVAVVLAYLIHLALWGEEAWKPWR